MPMTVKSFREFNDSLIRGYGDAAAFSFVEILVPRYEYPNDDEPFAEVRCEPDGNGIAIRIMGNPAAGALTTGKIGEALEAAELAYGSDSAMHWIFEGRWGNVLFETDSLEDFSYRITDENGDFVINPF